MHRVIFCSFKKVVGERNHLNKKDLRIQCLHSVGPFNLLGELKAHSTFSFAAAEAIALYLAFSSAISSTDFSLSVKPLAGR